MFLRRRKLAKSKFNAIFFNRPALRLIIITVTRARVALATYFKHRVLFSCRRRRSFFSLFAKVKKFEIFYCCCCCHLNVLFAKAPFFRCALMKWNNFSSNSLNYIPVCWLPLILLYIVSVCRSTFYCHFILSAALFCAHSSKCYLLGEAELTHSSIGLCLTRARAEYVCVHVNYDYYARIETIYGPI